MNSTLEKIKAARPDLSDYLYHFTNGANAKATLEKILADKKLIDINRKGVICFTEAPIYALPAMFEIFSKYSKPLYAPYGIAIPKRRIYEDGGRNVIYGPKEELEYFDPSIRWRYEEVSNKKDFTWLREWRIPASEVDLNEKECFIITKTTNEELETTFYPGDVVVDGDWADGQWWDQTYMDYEREWKSISLQTIAEKAVQNSERLNNEINAQKLGKQEDDLPQNSSEFSF
jgi:hypothetical protein